MSPRNADYDVRGPDVPRELFDDGRVRFSVGVPSGKEAQVRRDLIHRHLRRSQEWEVLRAVVDGVLHVATVVRLLQRHGEAGIAEIRGELERRLAGELPTFDEASEEFLQHYAHHSSPESVKSTTSRLSRVAEQEVPDRTGADVRLGALRIDQIQRAQVTAAVQAVSANPSSQANLYAAVSALFTWATEHEAEEAKAGKRAPRFDENPVQKVRMPKPRKRTTTLPREHVAALIQAGQLYQQVYVRVFAQIGLRLGEFVHTRHHTDFDPETWLWKIQGRGPDPRCRCPQCRKKGWSPKSARGVRTFRVPETQVELRESLAAWIDVTAPQTGDFLFPRPGHHGRPWSNRSMAKDFRALCQAADVRYGRKTPGGVVIHDLRHTAATELVRAGVRESVIAALLGDTVDEIVKTYVNLNSDDLADGIGRSPTYA